MSDTVRLFLGLELNDDARQALACVSRVLAGQGLKAKLHAPDLYHLTLIFLGNLPVSEIPRISRLTNDLRHSPFSLTLSDLGTFKGGSVLWAGVEHCPALTEYQAKLAHALKRAGYSFEEGEYRPHITLGRGVKTPVPSVRVPAVSFPVRHATLFESTRIDGRLTYVPLNRSVLR